MWDKFIDHLEFGTEGVFIVKMQVVSGYTVVSATLFNTSNILVYPNGERSNRSSHILLSTWTCDEVNNKASGTCSEILHLVNSRHGRRFKTFSFPTSTHIMYADFTFPTWVISFMDVKKKLV